MGAFIRTTDGEIESRKLQALELSCDFVDAQLGPEYFLGVLISKLEDAHFAEAGAELWNRFGVEGDVKQVCQFILAASSSHAIYTCIWIGV